MNLRAPAWLRRLQRRRRKLQQHHDPYDAMSQAQLQALAANGLEAPGAGRAFIARLRAKEGDAAADLCEDVFAGNPLIPDYAHVKRRRNARDFSAALQDLVNETDPGRRHTDDYWGWPR